VAWETALTGSTTDTVSYVVYYPLAIRTSPLTKSIMEQHCSNSSNTTSFLSNGTVFGVTRADICVSPLAKQCYAPGQMLWEFTTSLPTNPQLAYGE
jgi:hypothetical protein